ncbi:DUF4404 family protein [Gilvimarinus agarilyticus]|uniref:DUF4404 family protein n=1 Tax=unclassified Gilvimarinus TaxID=2642066 RepID=UPI001C088A7B|nr:MULTISPECIES: DUF4404 family protein [unclassified Gilvimarinus]MBU2886006.1 DUF4404 family protein [Gilvimarinus agarilyticus]MDO6570752.1 DUF4404 family protein [Gilvimarinus sp. 2_MG-2023]MDO6747655.1 DUF4404 family protein [Gilvimarinus sp. 1_MG-2023]
MSNDNLDQLIGRLHELFGTEDESPAQQRLMAELARHTHATGSDEQLDPRPLDTLEEMLDEFEGEHPQVSAVLGQVITSLKNMGI